MTYTIIKDTPPLEKKMGPKGSSKYPFAQMEVGDAFAFPIDERGWGQESNRIRSARFRWAKATGSTAEFSTGQIDETTGRCRRNS